VDGTGVGTAKPARSSHETGHTARAGTGARHDTAPDIAESVRAKSSHHTGRTGTGPHDSPSDIADSMDHCSERAENSRETGHTAGTHGSPLVKAKGMQSGDLIPLAI
jgi:hypothetical protein